MRTVIAATALLLTVVTAGCSEAEELVSDAASDAACSVAQQALDGVTGEAQQALDDLGADPAAARRELEALRDVVSAAESGLSGETRQRLEEARAALDDLVVVARDTAEGAPVDDAAVQQARDDLDEAVTAVTRLC